MGCGGCDTAMCRVRRGRRGDRDFESGFMRSGEAADEPLLDGVRLARIRLRKRLRRDRLLAPSAWVSVSIFVCRSFLLLCEFVLTWVSMPGGETPPTLAARTVLCRKLASPPVPRAPPHPNPPFHGGEGDGLVWVV
jgi:hypothetical protein